jgi:hypothetical protein
VKYVQKVRKQANLIYWIIPLLFKLFQPGNYLFDDVMIRVFAMSALGGSGPNAVLCKTCSVLLCVLAQPMVDNSSAGLIKRGKQLVQLA